MEFKLKTLETVLAVPKIANVHFFEYPRGHETRSDKHPFCELLFVNGGKVTVRSDEYNGTLSKNSLIIHGANKPHSFSCSKNAESSLVIIGFECNCAELAQFGKRPIFLNETEVKQMAGIVKEGRNVFAPPYNVPVYDMVKKKNQIFGSEQMLRCLLESFLLGLIRKHEYFEAMDESDDVDFAIGEIIEYVDGNYTERITIDELAFLFRTNRSTLCKEFRLATGKTLNKYITDKKIEKAKRKLEKGVKSVSQIADELNFESVPYFCKFFKKHTGLTPSKYQNTPRT